LFRLLHINPDERRKISLFFFQNFFEGLGVAFFYTLALTYFLKTNPIQNFPWVFVIAGAATMVFATIYARFEHHGIPSRLFTGLAIIIVLLLIFCWWTMRSSIDKMWIGILLLSVYQLIYYLNKMQFWGMSALSFDVRQSKRLFSVLSVGDLPAKFIGYTLVVGLVASGKVTLDQLIYASIVSYLISIYVLRIIIKEEPELNLRLGHDEVHEEHHKSTTSPIVKGLMVLAVANVFCVMLIEYLYAKEVKHHFDDLGGTAVSIIATTFAVSYGVATLLKLFVSGRLLQRISLKFLIVAMPAIIMVSILVFWIITPSGHKHDSYNYFFIILFAIELILKETLNKPLVLSLYQPLSKSQRLDGHTKVKGYFESAGMLLMGLFLMNVYRTHDHIDLNFSTVVLMIALSVWAIVGFGFGRVYLNNLRDLIASKLMRGDRSLFLDPETANFLKKKLRSSEELEVINAWDILQKHAALKEEDLLVMLHHENNDFRTMALNFLPKLKMSKEEKKKIIQGMFKDERKNIRLLSLEKYAELVSDKEWDELIYRFSEIDEKQALYKGFLNQGDDKATKIDAVELRNWLSSDDPTIQKNALHILGLSDFSPFHEEIKIFLLHDQPELRRAAIQSAYRHADEEVIEHLVELLRQRKFGFEVIKCLRQIPENMLEFLGDKLSGTGDFIDRKIIGILVAHSDAGRNLVNQYLQVRKPEMRDVLASELIAQSDKLKSAKMIKEQMEYEKGLLDHLNVELDDAIVQESIRKEAGYIFVRFLKWCYVYTGESSILKAIDHHNQDNDDKMATTIEAMQVSLPQSVFSMIRPYLEDKGRMKTNDPKSFMENFLRDHESYRDWLVGMLVSKLLSMDLDMANDLQNRNSKFVLECLDGIQNISHMEKANFTSIKLLERVLLLKQTAMFENTDENYLLEIAEVMMEKEYSKGSMIFQEGDEGNSMYIIVSGEVQVAVAGHVLATLKEKEFFGDLSLLDPAPRSASASTTKECVVLELQDQAIYELMADHIDVTRGIIKVLCERLRRQNQQYLKEIQKQQTGLA